MTRQRLTARRPRTPRPHHLSILAALGALLLWVGGCTPDIPTDSVPSVVELQFDPSATPPKSYEPTALIVDPVTRKLDFSAAGVDVPADIAGCQDWPADQIAQCEFYWYLEQLDGFPTLTPGKVPVSAPLDLATVTVPDNLFVYEFMHGTAPVTDLTVSYDDAAGVLEFDPNHGWDIGGVYFVGVRGYAHGVKGVNGEEAVASIIYVLLKQDSSLTCGATTADEISEDCAYYSLFASDARFSGLPPAEQKAAIGATLLQLEALRATYKGLVPEFMPFNLWDQVETLGNMPPEEVAILWAFPIHSNPVVELNPDLGMVPEISGTNEVRFKAKGTLDPATLKPFAIGAGDGTVFLLNATAFLSNDLGNALPTFTVGYVDGDIVVTTDAPLIDGNTYIALLTNEITSTNGKPLVPSPGTVLLRTRGTLVDDIAGCASTPPTAVSLVSGVSPALACQSEEGRLQFQALLDDDLVKSLTTTAARPNGLTREMVAYLYGFEYTAQ
jgi:hypothetical protein